jgi:hypothetical protein
MTSFAFILGVSPLVIAAGAGAEMDQALGTAVFAGMIGVTFFGILLTPVFFSVIMKFFGPKPTRAEKNVAARLEKQEDELTADFRSTSDPDATSKGSIRYQGESGPGFTFQNLTKPRRVASATASVRLLTFILDQRGPGGCCPFMLRAVRLSRGNLSRRPG